MSLRITVAFSVLCGTRPAHNAPELPALAGWFMLPPAGFARTAGADDGGSLPGVLRSSQSHMRRRSP